LSGKELHVAIQHVMLALMSRGSTTATLFAGLRKLGTHYPCSQVVGGHGACPLPVNTSVVLDTRFCGPWP